MSECVVRMRMPENCTCCPMCFTADVQGYHWCAALEQEVEQGLSRPKECPIICALPEGHGDLIDRDTFISKYLSYYTEQERELNLMFAAVEVKQQFADMICDEQAIVPAEPKEEEHGN